MAVFALVAVLKYGGDFLLKASQAFAVASAEWRALDEHYNGKSKRVKRLRG